MIGRIAILVALLLAVPVLASAWTTEPDGSTVCSSFGPGNSCYYDFSDTTDSGVLATTRCGRADVFFDPDEDGTNTGATIHIYKCHENTASANTCAKVLADTDGDGVPNDVTLNGDATALRAGRIFPAKYIWIDVIANGGSDDARVQVQCLP